MFGPDRDGDGIANGFEYAFGTSLQGGDLLLDIKIVDGKPVVEIPARDDASVPFVDVSLKGSTNLVEWGQPVVPTNGAPARREWFQLEGAPGQSFFKLETELK